MEKITSRTNPLMTHIRKLSSSAAYRREQGEFLCDSPKLLAEALLWKAPILTVVATSGHQLPPLGGDVRVVEVPEDVMASVSPMKTPQGVLFTCRLPRTQLPDTLEGRCYMVLDGVQDPGNVGTIWRTADAFGCDGLVLLPGCADPYSPKTVRSSMRGVPQQRVDGRCRGTERGAHRQRDPALRRGSARRYAGRKKRGLYPRCAGHRQ